MGLLSWIGGPGAWIGDAVKSALTGPIVQGAVDSYKNKLAAGNTSERLAAELAGRELAVQQREIELQAQLKIAQVGHPWEPEKLAFYVWLTYFAKCVVWDTVFGLGTTGPVRGNIDIWCNLIVTFYFAKRGIENVARIIRKS